MSAPVVLSMGMGVDSAAILTRWLLDSASRDFELADLVVLTAMTGDEYDVTGRLMNEHLLPLMREHAVRYVQIARAGQSDTAGHVVLSDSTATDRMVMRGPWALSDEFTNTGTLPQIVSGKRLCSMRAKGVPLDAWIAENLAGRPYRHVIGFAAEEQYRVDRDSSYTSNSRSPEYPLMAWGWDREACEAYLLATYGEPWSRSCCGYCPFQAGRAGIDALTARWVAEPHQAVKAIVQEHRALVLNPRSMLFGSRTARSVAAQAGLLNAIADADERIAGGGWAVYKVRRVYFAKSGDPSAKGVGWRSVETVATGTRAEMVALVAGRVDSETDRHGIARRYVRRAAAPYPSAEEMLVAGPAGVRDKERVGFAAAWVKVTQPQMELFGA